MIALPRVPPVRLANRRFLFILPLLLSGGERHNERRARDSLAMSAHGTVVINGDRLTYFLRTSRLSTPPDAS